MSFVKDTFYKQKGFVKTISERERISSAGLWLHWFYCYIRYGATPSDWYCYELYKYRHSTLRKFITRRKNIELDHIFNPLEYKEDFDNKMRFNKVYSEFVKRKWLHYPQSDISVIKQSAWGGVIVVKPLNLSSGRGIFTFDPSTSNWDELESKLQGKEDLLEQRVELHPEIERLNPPSCQTIRVYTVVDANGNVSVIDAVIRVGGGDAIQDNFHAKGVVYPIDLKTGRISSAGKDLLNNEYLVHPSSGIFMPGYQIPNWNGVLDFAIRAASLNKAARFIGWDVAITPSGFEMIEGNYYVYCGLMQIFDKKGKYELIKSYK